MISSADRLREIRSQRHIRFIFLFNIIGTVTCLSVGTAHILIYRSITIGVLELIAAVIAFINVFILYKTRNEQVCSSIVLLVMYSLLMAFLTYGGIANTGFVWFAVFPALAYGIKHHRAAHGWLAALFGGIVLHTILGSLQVVPAVYTVDQIVHLIIGLSALSILITIRKYFTEKDEEQLTQQIEEISTMNTILEKEQANENELQGELLRFKLAFDRAYDFMTISDKKGTILYTNASAERVTGYTQNELIGTKVGFLWGNQMSKKFYEKMWRTIHDEKKEYIGELENKRKNGQKYTAKITITPVLGIDDEVNFYIGIERDITHEKELEKAKDDFLSFAAHQLRTPVTAIKWYLEMMLDGTAGQLTSQQSTIVQKIEKTNQRMNELMHEFLNISRLESGRLTIHPQIINVKQFCHELQQEVSPLLEEKQIQVQLQIVPEDVTVKVDEGLFRQIMINYLTNAIKYTPPKRTITISAQQVSQNIKISVHDKGIGIPQIEQQNIFSKFYRAENARLTQAEGSGLGLYFVKKIVDIAGGEVGFESTVGEGSIFFVVVPSTGWRPHEGTISVSGSNA